MTDFRDPEIFQGVRAAFAEALGLDDDEVEYDATIIEELGAESLDLLDIVFRLERTFDIQIPRGGFELETRMTPEGPGEVDGRLTLAGCTQLRRLMPEVPPDEITVGLKVSELGTVFRVATFYHIVESLLAAKQVA